MILLQVLLAPFVTVLLVCGTLVYFFGMALRGDVAAELERIAEGHRSILQQFLLERTSDLRLVAGDNAYEALLDSQHLQGVLDQLRTSSPAFLDIGVFDEQGRHTAYVGPYDLEGKSYVRARWFREVQDKGVYVSDVFLGYRNTPHFVIAVKRNQGGRSWYLRATIDTQFFNSLVEKIRVGNTGEAYLLNADGIFQTERRSGGALMKGDPDFHTYHIQTGKISTFEAEDHMGSRYLYAVSRLDDPGWTLVVRQELADAYTPLWRAVLIAVAVIVAGGAVVVALAFYLASGLANKLTVAAMEKREMGSQLIMAGRLAEVGEMSAGVAHEINNPLQVMKSEYTLITDILDDIRSGALNPDPENMDQMRDSVDQISFQIDRCRDITQGLLKFARKSEATFEEIVLPDLIEEIVHMIEHQAMLDGVHIVRTFDPGLPQLLSDPGQLQQVFLNLINNAMHALGGREDGVIRIHTARQDDRVLISVTDNGCGIAPENLEKIFLPFFTTKPVGRGTGLGLSTCYGIVERLGGHISVSSEVGAGTVFTVRLPLPQEHALAGTHKDFQEGRSDQ